MFSWGENTRCGFGLSKPNPKDRENSGHSVDFTRTNLPVTDLAVGHRVVAFIRNDGKSSFARKLEENGKTITGKLKSLDCKEKISSLSCGDAYVVLLTEGGKVLHLNTHDPSNVPRPLRILQDRQVTRVACGDKHSIAITEDGQVFTWGENGSGQLGVGKGEPSSLTPRPLKSLSGIPLAQISAGGHHSFALSLSGAVFGWGRNSAGQLGQGDTADRLTPVTVDCLNLKKTVFLSCGEEHTAVLTKGGVVFTFGSGRHGQLGHNSLRDELRPRLVGELWGSKVTQIACGRHHTLAFVGSSNKVYSFGHGEQGQLGNGVKKDQSVPLPVQLSRDGGEDQQIQSIFAGGDLSFALCSLAQGTERVSENTTSCWNTIQTLNEDVIHRWVTEYDTKSWSTIQREITEIFSSPACLNASFLDKSRDKHYQTSNAQSGLDLSLGRLAFQKLATQEKVLAKVEEVVLEKLLPSLPLEEPLCVESLRVYLLLPELLRVLPRWEQGAARLNVAVAEALLSLHSHKLLEALWSKLPYYFFRTVVRTFHSMAVWYSRWMVGKIPFNKSIERPLNASLELIRKLYEVNCNRRLQMAPSNFYIKEMTILFGTPFVFLNRQIGWSTSSFMQKVPKIISESLPFFVKHPCVLEMEAKCRLFILSSITTPLNTSPFIVSREALLQEVFDFLRQKVHNFRAPLKVKFKEENGIDYGGVSLEFYTVLAKQLLASDPKILEVNEHSALTWFPSDDRNSTDKFHLLGVICGMALYNRCPLNVCFPLALFKKLLGLTPTLGDLKELSPVEARSLQVLLTEDEEVVEEQYLDFTYKGQELIPNGGEVLVTKVNRQKFVDLYVNMVFNKSVEWQFEEFKDGFLEGCPLEVWRAFLPEELMTLLNGEDKYEWEELKKNAQYVGYSPTDKIIQNFWTVFTEFSENEKKDFLTFLTGTNRLPRGRHSQLKMNIKRLYVPDADEYYPEAETCFVTLQLPNYSSITILRQKLLHAVTHCEVIGKQ